MRGPFQNVEGLFFRNLHDRPPLQGQISTSSPFRLVRGTERRGTLPSDRHATFAVPLRLSRAFTSVGCSFVNNRQLVVAQPLQANLGPMTYPPSAIPSRSKIASGNIPAPPKPCSTTMPNRCSSYPFLAKAVRVICPR